MEKMKVFGIQSMNFDTKDGNHIEGIKLHCFKDAPNEYWQGDAYEGIFISVRSALIELAKQVKPCDLIEVSFNRYGKPDGFTISK